MLCRLMLALLHKECCGVMSVALTTLLLVAAAALFPATATATSLLQTGLLPMALGEGLEDLVRIAADTCEALPLEALFLRRGWGPVRVQAWSRRGRRSYRTSRVPLARDAPLYVPGWGNTPDDEAARALVHALLARHRRVLVLDTRAAFCRGYLSAASRVRALADALYSLVRDYASRGLPPESLHVIGFSLGAHVAGLAGKLVIANMNAKIGKITALDPARPCFARTAFRLDRDDARFVQVVHTSSGVLGLEHPVGHVDVYVNGLASGQPECAGRGITLECDHAQAWRMYAASVSGAMTATACAGWAELARGDCGGNLTAVGYSCSPDVRGLFLYRSEKGG